MPRVLDRLGSAPTPAVMEVVFTRWVELVGPELVGHLRPQRVDGRVLVVAVEHPGSPQKSAPKAPGHQSRCAQKPLT